MTGAPRLICTPGDPAGIGPEVVLRALAEDPPDAIVTLLGERDFWAGRAAALGIPLEGRQTEAGAESLLGIEPGRPVERGGLVALSCLEAAVTLLEKGAGDALVTAPLNKDLVARHAPSFLGHTEWLARRSGIADPTMLFAAPRRDGTPPGADIALLTTHLPLATALTLVRTDRVSAMLRRVARQWAAQFGRRSRIGLAALNPHAGEAGRLGDEETRVLAPAIQSARDAGVDVRGPFPADSIFLRDDLDLILALYHDQGTIMAKRAPWPTVNLTLGLPYVRTSPDHGTAYDRAAVGGADWRPMAEAFHLAAALVRRQDGPGGATGAA